GHDRTEQSCYPRTLCETHDRPEYADQFHRNRVKAPSAKVKLSERDVRGGALVLTVGRCGDGFDVPGAACRTSHGGPKRLWGGRSGVAPSSDEGEPPFRKDRGGPL